MVRLMVGRDVTTFHHRHELPNNDACFEVRRIQTERYPACQVSLSIRRGEILGVAGLIGSGRSELAQAIFGIDTPLSGTILVDGKEMVIRSPRDAIEHGIYLVPEDRRNAGLITSMTIRENITLSALSRYSRAGWISDAAELRVAQRMCVELKIKTPSIETAAENLSGGNQQKVALAKWLSLDPRVILFDEPTRGIDVGAKSEIHQLMRKLADQGVAILMISSDMEEILGNSDRVAVMHEGRVTGVLERSECSQEAIMRLAVA
jgi:ribose transport system ATP-binding protein